MFRIRLLTSFISVVVVVVGRVDISGQFGSIRFVGRLVLCRFFVLLSCWIDDLFVSRRSSFSSCIGQLLVVVNA
jgi:hypothetical protein